MTLTELQDEVYSLTNRPDLVAQTLTAVRSATLKIHQLDYFYRDVVEDSIQFPTSTYLQQLEFKLLFPRWRALKYLRKTDIQGNATMPFFRVIPIPESSLDDYNVNENDVCYGAGDVLQIRSSTEFKYAFIGFYQNPDITMSGYSSWVAVDHPYAIVFEAASLVFKMIGDTDQFAAYNLLAAEQKNSVIISNIQAVGY